MNNILDYLIENRETFYVEGTKEGAFNVLKGVKVLVKSVKFWTLNIF
jgi:hypothetical protein